MAKNTNPLTTRLLIKQNWNTISLPINYPGGHSKKGSNELFQDNYIRELINGVFLKLGILTSDIRISKTCLDLTTISFAYYPLNHKNSTINKLITKKHIVDLIKMIKLLLKLKYPNKIFKLISIKAPHKFVEPKILNDYIHYSVMDDPNRIKFTLINLIREFRLLETKK